jgi:hypothetical protein
MPTIMPIIAFIVHDVSWRWIARSAPNARLIQNAPRHSFFLIT